MHAHLLQGPRQARNSVSQLGIGVAPAAKHRRQGMRSLLQRVVQTLGEVHGVLLKIIVVG
ncbi:hypothetical protein D3C81_2245650 [compost metagenome]